MSTTGEKYPTYGSTTSETPYDDNVWTTPEYVTADDGNTANVTPANFDTDDYTEVLKAYTFDFSGIPSGATIDGVICRINCWYANGTADIVLVQLLDVSRAKGGDNKASTPVAMSTDTGTVETFGGAADKWGLSLTESWVKDADFGVAVAIQATQDNADVFVDYVTLEVYYTEAGGVQVTPAAAIAEGSSVNPGLVLGSVSLTPVQAETVASVLGATVCLGSLIVTPAVAEALAATLDPSVVVGGGGIYVTPAQAEAEGSCVDPGLTLGSVSLTPAQATGEGSCTDPPVVLGSIILAPGIAEAGAGALNPVVSVGGVYVTPAAAEALTSVYGPVIVMDSMSVTPAQAVALALAMNPGVLEGEPELAQWVCLNLLTLGVGGRR